MIPAARVVQVTPEGSSSVAWWVIVVSILAAMIVVAVVGVLLWVVSVHQFMVVPAKCK